ncbi:protein kinase, putative [Bodo saltans]|uniref:Protein kinase, putative n=1 Tax=Bodo saltans TaxID=75058 RepID=A0A0S4JPT4_BODSA|nr:protein kinase, putative [Bodo saltans]|eukprot:CUG90523.1 protein kinase, putative [Bodo saltans]
MSYQLYVDSLSQHGKDLLVKHEIDEPSLAITSLKDLERVGMRLGDLAKTKQFLGVAKRPRESEVDVGVHGRVAETASLASPNFTSVEEAFDAVSLLVEETISPSQSPQASPHSPSEETNFRIEHLENSEHSRTFNQKTDLTIGRDPHSCSLVFPEAATLSRVHCKFFCLGREVFLTDVSSNGTFLNGKMVGKNNQRALRTNDLVSLINPQQPESTKLTWRFIAPEGPTALPSAGAGDASNIEAHYKLGEVLGTGNFATVRLGTHRTNGRNVAVKIVEKKRFALQEGEFSFSSLKWKSSGR